MLRSLTSALKLRRSSSSGSAIGARDDDLDLVAFMNESRTDSERRQVAYVASMRHGR